MSFRERPAIFALSACCLFLMGQTAESAEICDDFSTVISSSRDGFAEVRGELVSGHLNPVNDMRVLYQCQKMLPGASTCEIEWFRQTYAYHAFWHRQDLEAHARVFKALTELLAGCGMTLEKTSKTGRSSWWVVEGEADFDITLAYNSHRVRLSFAKLGAANP